MNERLVKLEKAMALFRECEEIALRNVDLDPDPWGSRLEECRGLIALVDAAISREVPAAPEEKP